MALGVIKDVNQRFKVRFIMDNVDEQIDIVSNPVRPRAANNSDTNAGMIARLRTVLSDMRFGEVTILVQDSQIVRIDIDKRIRLNRSRDEGQ